jgi:hypothetical protein
VVLSFLSASVLCSAAPAEATAPELEAKFKATMTGATMAGRWIPLKDGALGPERDDKYSIVSVEKVAGSTWTINARLHGVVIPIPVDVKWAGDTAVIIVEALQIPGANGYAGSSYSARVLIHEHTYAGTWSGGNHGGFISGLITNE